MIRESFDTDWYVTTSGSVEKPPIGPVTVPYDAMLFEERDPDSANGGNTGFYPGGVYRYTKRFDAPLGWDGQIITLEFEGVYQKSQVFINGELAGGRPSGYALFHVEIQKFLNLGTTNVLEVVADNSDMPNSRWYSGSGIYRPVHLLIGAPLHIAPTGIRAITKDVVGDSATVAITTTVVNAESSARTVIVRTTLTDPSGAALAPIAGELVVPSGGSANLAQVIPVTDAALWSPETPQLYGVVVEVLEAGAAIDRASEEFGIRIVTADSKNGLRINGNKLKLRGSAIHHDNGVIGAVALDAAEDRRIRLMKASGYNAVRSAHNPASRALLRACDRNGMLVMDELTDAWFRPKSKHDYSEIFAEWWERDLEALVANSSNHPSVIMYSIGNEISETANPRGIAMNRTIAQRTRELDPSRLVTNGINGFLNLIAPQDEEKTAAKAAAAKDKDEAPNKNLIRILNAIIGILDKMLDRIVRLPAVDKRTREAFADLDVTGYNYMIGRYKKDGELHPDRVIVGSETRAALSARIWKVVEPLDHVIGDFTWTGWDYIGEAGIAAKEYGTTKRSIYHPYPALLAGEPVIDITGFRQTQSYVNEIAWHLSAGPHIAVEPVNHAGEKSVKTGWRATNSVSSWSWEGFEGRTAVVEVYADAARVTLQLDGTTIGSRTPGKDGDFLAKFELPYRPGELTAIAYGADGAEIGRQSLKSATSGLQLSVVPESSELIADGKDLVYLPVLLTDVDGILKPGLDRAVTVSVEGPAFLAGFGSAEPTTTEGFASDTHTTYYGRAQAVIRATRDSGTVVVTVSAEGCETVRMTLVSTPLASGSSESSGPAQLSMKTV